MDKKRILFLKVISVFCLSMIFLFFSLSTIAQSDSKYKIVAVATGNKHCLALRSDGTVWAWGNNEHGQLGNGTTTKSNKPIQVKGLTNVVAIAGGENHSVALKKDGTVWAWGIKECLGNNINNDSTVPVQVKYLKDIISIGAGFNNSIAVQKGGTVWTWGDNMYLQLGKEDYDGYLPIQVQGLNNVRQAACGLGFCIVVKNDGTVWAWGWNKNTHFCVDASDINDETFADPRKVQKISNIKEVSGFSYILALKNNGLVLHWGDGRFPEVVKGVEGVKSISEGYSHSLAVKRDGTVWAWGLNDQGQLGNGNIAKKYFKPTQVKGLSNIISIAAGEGYSVAVDSNGTVWAWGVNEEGQLGDGTFTNKSKPVKVIFKSITSTTSLNAPNTVITDISNWRHPVKEELLKYGYKPYKIELTKDNKYPIFYVYNNSGASIYDIDFLKSIAQKNGYWDFKIVDGKKFVEVFCDRQKRKIIKTISDIESKNWN